MSAADPPVQKRVGVVLVVDDDDGVRRLFCRALGASGFVTHGAGSIAEARAMIGRHEPDLILLDRHLPDGDGWDFARAVRGVDVTREIPIVGVTARRTRDDMDNALVAGCDAFIEKPCEARALVRHVRGMLGMPLDDAKVSRPS